MENSRPHNEIAVALTLVGLFLVVPVQARDAELDLWRTADAPTVQAMLSLARRAFESYVTNREVIEPPEHLPDLLRQRAAVFVSAMRHGAPRCCMGTLYASEPDAAHEIIASAVAAAGRDRRFPPIQPGELKGLTLIVSIVETPRSIRESELSSLDPTREGLVARCDDRVGVVLSCETTRVARMISWARIRAGAKAMSRRVNYFRIHDVRFVENDPPGVRR